MLYLEQGRSGRIMDVDLERLPTRTVRRIESDRFGKVINTGFVRIGAVAVLALPKKSFADDLAGKGHAVLALDNLAEVFAKGCKALVVQWLGQGHGNLFIGTRRLP